MNVALKIYPDALFVLPVYQSFWIVFGIASGLIFYQEYKEMNEFSSFMFGLGVAISLVVVPISNCRFSIVCGARLGLVSCLNAQASLKLVPLNTWYDKSHSIGFATLVP